MTVHYFDTSREAADAAGQREEIIDGDVLVAVSEGLAAVVCEGWPVSVTADHGSFEHLARGYTFRDFTNTRYASAAEAALRVLENLSEHRVSEYHVAWETGVSASSPQAAAEIALERLIEAADTEAAFTVTSDGSDDTIVATTQALNVHRHAIIEAHLSQLARCLDVTFDSPTRQGVVLDELTRTVMEAFFGTPLTE